ncbi:MAG: type II toxin-antitoxin system RatA family toxin [Gammaproteobacteria bacterium]
MTQVIRSIIAPYNACEMYSLANDVDRYQDFLPWCKSSEVVERSASQIQATIEIAYKGFNTSFTTRNTLIEGQLIEMRLVEGSAFESLEGDWRFRDIDQMACQIELEVNFSLAGKLGAKVLSPVFSRICTELVDAFVDRAKVLYGERAFA